MHKDQVEGTAKEMGDADFFELNPVLMSNDVGPVLQPVGLESVQDLVGRDPALPGLDAAVAHLKDRLPPLVMDAPAWQRFAARTFRPGPDGAWHPRWDIR
ncbi:MAG: hypothetical protein B7Z13_08760, partial [Caulobacterales bacterium 32-67-6]